MKGGHWSAFLSPPRSDGSSNPSVHPWLFFPTNLTPLPRNDLCLKPKTARLVLIGICILGKWCLKLSSVILLEACGWLEGIHYDIVYQWSSKKSEGDGSFSVSRSVFPRSSERNDTRIGYRPRFFRGHFPPLITFLPLLFQQSIRYSATKANN